MMYIDVGRGHAPTDEEHLPIKLLFNTLHSMQCVSELDEISLGIRKELEERLSKEPFIEGGRTVSTIKYFPNGLCLKQHECVILSEYDPPEEDSDNDLDIDDYSDIDATKFLRTASPFVRCMIKARLGLKYIVRKKYRIEQGIKKLRDIDKLHPTSRNLAGINPTQVSTVMSNKVCDFLSTIVSPVRVNYGWYNYNPYADLFSSHYAQGINIDLTIPYFSKGDAEAISKSILTMGSEVLEHSHPSVISGRTERILKDAFESTSCRKIITIKAPENTDTEPPLLVNALSEISSKFAEAFKDDPEVYEILRRMGIVPKIKKGKE